jgi:hypothetical protein
MKVNGKPTRTIWVEPHGSIGIVDPDLEPSRHPGNIAAPTPKPPGALLVFVDRQNDGQTSVRRLECEMA